MVLEMVKGEDVKFVPVGKELAGGQGAKAVGGDCREFWILWPK